MPVDRDAVRDTAKYLRQVRPIDPAEVSEYVPDQPDPRVIQQVLREQAMDLGLAEGADGLFRPAATGPFRPDFDGVDWLPKKYESQLESLLVERYGPEWHQGETGAKIRERIDRLKADYFDGRSVQYDRDVALAYAIYHLADYYASTQYILATLAQDGLVPSQASVLDVGAGVGGPALAIADLFDVDRDPTELPILDYHAIEPSPAAAVFESLLGDGPRNVTTELHRQPAEQFDPADSFDLIFFNNVLSELETPVETAERYLEFLTESGTLVLTAPADRNTSIQLRRVERNLETRGETVYGPTVRLWPDERPTDTCWSFDQRPDIDVPSVQAALAGEADRAAPVQNTSVKFSYSVLRRDGKRRYDFALDRSNVAKLGDMEAHVGSRIDLVVGKLSGDLSEDGHPLYKISDGSESVSHFAVLVNETELNQDLSTAEYGDIIQITGGLALFNEDEAAYNIVVDEETIIDRA
ncbi:MAG: class I SAM-dependent methyltransferase [Halodesulfurarchaeum sp.]|nr:class I SAM-dependent methyltransferase [Halodesulfurarchaeum sp.]